MVSVQANQSPLTFSPLLIVLKEVIVNFLLIVICFDPSLHRIEDDSKDPFMAFEGFFIYYSRMAYVKNSVSSSQTEWLGFSCCSFCRIVSDTYDVSGVWAGEICETDNDCCI